MQSSASPHAPITHRVIRLLAFCGACLFPISAQQSSPVLYDGGSPNNVTAGNITYFINAELFQLVNSATVTTVHTWISSASRMCCKCRS